MFSVEAVGKWLAKSEGRDKLCKVLQYICRLLTAHFRSESQYKTLIYETLFQALRDARKLFRLFKSVDEFQAIKHLLFFQQMDKKTILQIIYHLCYFVYWIVDNLTIAAKVKIIRINWKPLHALSLKIRCLALIVSLTTFLNSLQEGIPEEQKGNAWIKAGRDILDLFPASKDAQLFSSLDEKIVSIGGLASSLLSSYMVFINNAIK